MWTLESRRTQERIKGALMLNHPTETRSLIIPFRTATTNTTSISNQNQTHVQTNRASNINHDHEHDSSQRISFAHPVIRNRRTKERVCSRRFVFVLGLGFWKFVKWKMCVQGSVCIKNVWEDFFKGKVPTFVGYDRGPNKIYLWIMT